MISRQTVGNERGTSDMLLELTVRNLALLKSMTITFESGLSTLTGETGAGKSILLDALGLLVGGRGSVELIRQGADRAVVQGLFSLPADERGQVVRCKLDDAGLCDEDEDGHQLLIEREVHQSGRTVCRLNGRLTTVSMLRDIGASLVQLHGQHEHHGLLRRDEQLRMLDLYGGHADAVNDARSVFEQWQTACKQLQAAQIGEQERIRQLDIVQFQIAEIDAISPQPGEEDSLRADRARWQHADRILLALQAAVVQLQGGVGQPGAIAALATANSELATALVHEPRLTEAAQLLETAQVYAQETAHTLVHQIANVESDPAALTRVDDRLAAIRSLQRKYGASLDAVLAHRDAAETQRQQLLHHEERVTSLQQAHKEATERMTAVVLRLRADRQVAAVQLSAAIAMTLRQLGVPHALFHIALTARTDEEGHLAPGPDGGDVVEFLFSANQGEPMRPLSKIASGGELSRTLLALKSSLAAVDDVDTLVFDEIDAGVSGTAAHQIALQLRKLAVDRQAFCVTHSAQVAAAADHQFAVRKHENAAGTTSSVLRLDAQGRQDEISRLIGSDLSDVTAKEHATALLKGFHAVT